MGVEIYDINGVNISNVTNQCGQYNVEHKMRFQYISEVNTVNYFKSNLTCVMPINAVYINVKFGYMNNSLVPWNFDDVWLSSGK